MKYKNLVLFVAITFFRSVFVSILKFFLWPYLKEINISLEEITGFLSLWTVIAYLIWWALVYSFRKKNITIVAGLVTIGCLVIGHILGYYPFWLFVVLISTIGFVYGLWLIIKSVILSIEIQKSNHGEGKINGIINIAILSGILLWSSLGFIIFDKRGGNGVYFIIGLLVFSSILTMFMEYDQQFETKPFLQTIKQSIPSIGGIIKKYIQLLLPIGVLRAISTAMVQKMLEIGIDLFQRAPKSSIIIIIVTFIGGILGHVLSAFVFKKRKNMAMICTIIFWLATIYFPHIIERYEFYMTLNIFWFFIGVFFWLAVNPLEWRYFFHIGDDHRKEYGSATYGIVTSIIIFLIMIASDYLNNAIGSKISFFFFGIILLVMPFFIKNFDAKDRH